MARYKKPPAAQNNTSRNPWTAPTQRQLFEAIESIKMPHYYPQDDETVPAKLQKLKEAAEAAQHAVDMFEQFDKGYNKLKQAAQKATQAHDAARKSITAELRKEQQRMENLVRLKGPIPQVIEAVQKFVEKYQ